MKFLIPDSVNPAVKAEQIRLLYHQGVAIQLLGVVTAVIAASLFWPVADHAKLLLWFFTLLGITLLRLGLALKFEKGSTERFTLEEWGRLYVAGTLLSGLMWGSLALFFDASWPAYAQVALFVIFAGVIAGAFNANSSYFIAFPAFYLPMIIILGFVSLQQEDTGFYQISLLFLIYGVLMYTSSLKFHNRLAESLRVRFENEELAQQLARSNAKLAQLADMDELTQLYNRRALDRTLLAEWERHLRNQKPLSLLFIDIDFFKQYNDTYGHEGGDRCLVEVAQLIKNNAKRASDMATRYGGEEFAVILPETEREDAVMIAEKMCAELRELQIPHAASPVSASVTMSIGVATMLPLQAGNAEALLSASDKALYGAKEAGRDRVVCAEAEV